MSFTDDLTNLASKANAVFNSITANATAITSMSVAGQTINSTGFAVTATFSNTFAVGTAAYFVANGNVGINTSSPNQKLQVDGGLRIGASATLTNTTSAGLLSYEYPDLRVYVGDGSGYSVRFSKRAANTTTDYVTINDQGSVGIGTTSPSHKLQVESTTDTVISAYGGSGYAGYVVVNGNARSGLTGALKLISYSNGTAEIFNASNAALVFGANNTERMRISAGGLVTKPNHPAFQAYGAGFGSQYFSNRFIGNYATYNNGSYFSAMAGGGTGRFTAPVAGYYYFYAGALWYGATASSSPRQVYILKNGSNFNNYYADSTGPNFNMVVSCIMNLAAGDYVEAYAQSTSAYFYDNGATAGSYGGSTYNWFGGYLLG